MTSEVKVEVEVLRMKKNKARGHAHLSGCLSPFPSSSNLVITYLVMGNSIHIKPFSLHPVLRDMK